MNRPTRFLAALLLSFGIFLGPLGRAHAGTPPAVIPVEVTSRMWDASAKRQMATPPSVIAKIQKALDLWSSVSDAGLRFRYAGTVDAEYQRH